MSFTDVSNLFPNFVPKENVLGAYGDQLDMKSDFYEVLVKTFTYNGKFYCAPKDFSTLALIINTDLWTKAGSQRRRARRLGGQLETVAKKLTPAR